MEDKSTTANKVLTKVGLNGFDRAFPAMVAMSGQFVQG